MIEEIKPVKRTMSPTGCVHAVSHGDEHYGYATVCNHNDYNRSYGDGFFHLWPRTSEHVTCKRCLALMKPSPTHKITLEVGEEITPAKLVDILENAGALESLYIERDFGRWTYKVKSKIRIIIE